MGTRLQWTKIGEAFDRVYLADGATAKYRIDLEEPPVDRWILYVDGERVVEDIFWIKAGQELANQIETNGRVVDVSADIRFREGGDGRSPRVLGADLNMTLPDARVQPTRNATISQSMQTLHELERPLTPSDRGLSIGLIGLATALVTLISDGNIPITLLDVV